MAFGSLVTDFDQQAIGAYGYTIKIPIDPTGLNANVIYAVQAQASSSDTPEPVTTKVLLSTLESYLNDSACPDLAFAADNSNLFIFFATATFDYVADTRFAVFGLRNAQPTTVDTDLLDIIDDDLELLIAYIIQAVWLSFKFTKNKYIEDAVATEERKITG